MNQKAFGKAHALVGMYEQVKFCFGVSNFAGGNRGHHNAGTFLCPGLWWL
jgi:hypothetical protein